MRFLIRLKNCLNFHITINLKSGALNEPPLNYLAESAGISAIVESVAVTAESTTAILSVAVESDTLVVAVFEPQDARANPNANTKITFFMLFIYFTKYKVVFCPNQTYITYD
jgi:hypothetical protein